MKKDKQTMLREILNEKEVEIYDLNEERRYESSRLRAGKKTLNRLGSELDRIEKVIAGSNVVAGISGAVGFISAFLAAGTSDYQDYAHTGVDAFAMPEVQTALGICAAAFAVTGLAAFVANRLEHRHDDKLDRYNAKLDVVHGIGEHIREIDGQIADASEIAETVDGMIGDIRKEEIIKFMQSEGDFSTSTTTGSDSREYVSATVSPEVKAQIERTGIGEIVDIKIAPEIAPNTTVTTNDFNQN